MMLLFMFYARLFEKLRSRVRAVEKVNFWDVIDTESPAIGFSEALDFTIDFGLGDFVSKHTMQRIWRTVVKHPNQDVCFKARINLDQFEELLVVLADQLYHAPKWTLVTRERRVKRIIAVLGVESPRAIKAKLFDGYRDNHLSKYDELHDFEEVYHRHVLKTLPSTPVIPLPVERRVRFLEDTQLLQMLKKLEWMDPNKQWEGYPMPFIDMGVMALGGSREFRVDILNQRYHMLELNFSLDGMDPVEVSFHQKAIPSGAKQEVTLTPKPTMCGEWTGFLDVSGEVATGQTHRTRVPLYLRVVPAHGSVLADHVPKAAPWPFHKRAACAELRGAKELDLDPESNHNFVKRTPGAAFGFAPAQVRHQAAAKRPTVLSMNRAPRQGRGEWANHPDPSFPGGVRGFNNPARPDEVGRDRPASSRSGSRSGSSAVNSAKLRPNSAPRHSAVRRMLA
jgi:hypothetical protein